MLDTNDTTMLAGMAWERAKGELRSIAHLFMGAPERLTAYDLIVEKFIKEMEDDEYWAT